MNGKEESLPLAEALRPPPTAWAGADVWCCAFHKDVRPSWFLLDNFAVVSGAHSVTHPLLGAQLGSVLLCVMEDRSGAACQACSLGENAL